MPWYRTGTASFTNGNAAVTGSGTAWNANIARGEALLGPDGRLYEILSIGSDTALTLGSPYLGSTVAGAAYAVAPTQAYLRDLAAQAATLVNSYSSIAGGVFTAVKAGDGSAATPGLTFNSDQDTGFYRPTTNVIAVATAGAERLRVDATGNVGINATTPRARLDIGNPTTGSVVNSDIHLGYAVVDFYGHKLVNSNNPSASAGGLFKVQRGTGAVWLDDFVIDNTGNVGIGTAPTAQKVTIAGAGTASTALPALVDSLAHSLRFTSNVAGASTSGITYSSGGGGGAAVAFARDAGWGTNILFGTNPASNAVAASVTEVMRLDPSGNLMVGTTGPLAKLTVNNATASTASMALSMSNATGPNFGVDMISAATAPNTTAFIRGYVSASTLVFNVAGNGNVTNTNNSYGAISDAKLKENVTDASPKLADLMAVRVRSYNLTTDPAHRQIGVIAQELEEVFPGLVEETDDYITVTRTREVEVPAVLNEEGGEVTPATTREEEYTEREATGTVTKSVKYSVFVPMLIKAMQEQQALIVALTARLDALDDFGA